MERARVFLSPEFTRFEEVEGCFWSQPSSPARLLRLFPVNELPEPTAREDEEVSLAAASSTFPSHSRRVSRREP